MADLLIGASVIAVLLIARWMLLRLLVTRGEVAEVPHVDEGEANCTDPADPVDEHALQAIAALNPPVSDDARDAALLALGDYVVEERRHFEQWERQMGRADR